MIPSFQIVQRVSVRSSRVRVLHCLFFLPISKMFLNNVLYMRDRLMIRVPCSISNAILRPIWRLNSYCAHDDDVPVIPDDFFKHFPNRQEQTDSFRRDSFCDRRSHFASFICMTLHSRIDFPNIDVRREHSWVMVNWCFLIDVQFDCISQID